MESRDRDAGGRTKTSAGAATPARPSGDRLCISCLLRAGDGDAVAVVAVTKGRTTLGAGCGAIGDDRGRPGCEVRTESGPK